MSPKTSRGGKNGKAVATAGAGKGGKKAEGTQKGGKGKGKPRAKALAKPAPAPVPAPTTSEEEEDKSIWATCTNDVMHVQNILERCLRLYMSRDEVTTHLQRTANIEPVFTWLVWERLEKDNPEFFEAYYVMVRMKDQIIRFNALLEKYEEGLQQTQGGEKPKKSPPKRGAAAAAAAATGKRNKKNVKVEEEPTTNQGLGNWADVAGSPFGLGATPPSGMFMNAAMNVTSPFPTATPSLPKTPFSTGLELSADDMYSLMMTPSTLNNHSLAARDLQTNFENHARGAYAPGSELRNQLPTEFSLDDIPDFSLSPH